MKKQFVSSVISVSAGLTAFAGQDAPPPNLLLIFIDDLGDRFLGCYREDISEAETWTPHIDRLAATGVRMTDGYVTASICSPSRAALITGRYQQTFGMYGNPDASVGMPEDVKMMADYLSPHGYSCGWIGKSHLGWDMHPLDRNFDRFYGFLGGWQDYYQPGLGHTWEDGAGESWVLDGREPVEEHEYLTYEFGRQALDFIAENEQAGTPWALYLAHLAVHSPTQAPWDTAKHRGGKDITDWDLRIAMVEALDNTVGWLLDKLEDLEALENTLIFFIGDNGGRGNSFRAGKGSLYEGGIRVPYIVSMPGTLQEGTVYSRPVSSLDVLPTFFSLAGLSEGTDVLDGVNLVPYLRGEREGDPHDALFWQYAGFDPDAVTRFAIRQGDWKLVRDRSYEKALELYDLGADPGETTDLSEERPELVDRLWAVHAQWRQTLAPPLVPSGSRETPWNLELRRKYGSDWQQKLREEHQRRNEEAFETMLRHWEKEKQNINSDRK